jgi:hypothetical protein
MVLMMVDLKEWMMVILWDYLMENLKEYLRVHMLVCMLVNEKE